MRLEFEKMHGAGNDFVMIEDMQDALALTEGQVRWLCDRHKGIGADGVIVVKPSPRSEAAAYMHYINSDGTLAQMCGNGVRCFAKYIVDHKIVDAASGSSLVADTMAGPRPIEYECAADGAMMLATVNMGTPVLNPPDVPTLIGATREIPGLGPAVISAPLESACGSWEVTCVSMGNPHAVIFVDDPDSFAVAEVGPAIENLTSAFPEKTNVEFAHVLQGDGGTRIRMRVWERGCGETLACGTGACATAVAAFLAGRAGRESTLCLLGGDLHIRWDEATGAVFMTGPAECSFAGSVCL